MKLKLLVRGAAALSLLTLPMATVAVTTPAHAQTDGVSRCGADGYVERYSGYLHSWSQTMQKCRGPGSGSSYGNDGGNQDGVSRCGADGYVERYSGYLHSWSQTMQKCR